MKTISLILVAALSACAANDPGDSEDDVADTSGKADGITYPAGTYTRMPKVGELSSLSLVSDKSYELAFLHVDCIPGRCGPETGNFKFTRSGTHHYIRLLDDAGDLVDKYEWKLVSHTTGQPSLSLRRSGESTWMTLEYEDGGLGGFCGGFGGIGCVDDLVCKVTARIPDVPGECRHP